MLYLVGVYHPRPGKHDLPAGYDLSRENLQQINVKNVPLTIEHRGIFEAVDRLSVLNNPISGATIGAELDKLAETTDELAKPVGVVIEGRESRRDSRWYCLCAVDTDSIEIVPFLIEKGALRGLSLTHLTGETLTGTEISLCYKPARPECYVQRMFRSLSPALEYMRSQCSPLSASMSDSEVAKMETTEPKIETFDDAVEAMDPAVREIVAARFEEMVKKVQQEHDRANELEKTKNTLKINSDLMKAQIEQMSKNMDPEVQRVYACSPEQLSSEFESSNEAIFKHAAQRMLMACNHQLMMANAKKIAPSAPKPQTPKRKAETQEVVPEPKLLAASAAAAVETPAPETPKDRLAAALSKFASFEMM